MQDDEGHWEPKNQKGYAKYRKCSFVRTGTDILLRSDMFSETCKLNLCIYEQVLISNWKKRDLAVIDNHFKANKNMSKTIINDPFLIDDSLCYMIWD